MELQGTLKRGDPGKAESPINGAGPHGARRRASREGAAKLPHWSLTWIPKTRNPETGKPGFPENRPTGHRQDP
jgi:hypothetical protein